MYHVYYALTIDATTWHDAYWLILIAAGFGIKQGIAIWQGRHDPKGDHTGGTLSESVYRFQDRYGPMAYVGLGVFFSWLIVHWFTRLI